MALAWKTALWGYSVREVHLVIVVIVVDGDDDDCKQGSRFKLAHSKHYSFATLKLNTASTLAAFLFKGRHHRGVSFWTLTVKMISGLGVTPLKVEFLLDEFPYTGLMFLDSPELSTHLSIIPST